MERSLPPHENASDLWPWKLSGATPCGRRDPVLGAGHSNTPDHVRFVLHFSSSRLVRRLRNFDIRKRTRKNRPSNFRTYLFIWRVGRFVYRDVLRFQHCEFVRLKARNFRPFEALETITLRVRVVRSKRLVRCL